MDSWHVRRPFSWGLIHILDRDTAEIPSLTDSVVSASPHGLAVKVLHAADVDVSGFEADEVIPSAQVEVNVQVGNRASSDVLFEVEMDVPSGVLTVGDAEQEDSLEIGPGRWAVQVACAPREFAESVRVWLQLVRSQPPG